MCGNVDRLLAANVAAAVSPAVPAVTSADVWPRWITELCIEC